MTKKCSFKDCNEEIPVWGQYCANHYNMLMEAERRRSAQPDVRQQAVQEPPRIPESNFNLNLSGLGQEKPAQVPQNAPSKAVVVDSSVDRVDLRTKCLDSAVKLITGMEFEKTAYSDLVEQIKTLVNEFEHVVLEF